MVLVGWALGNAIASHHRARAHGYQADSDNAVFADGVDVLRKSRSIQQPEAFHNPDDEDLAEVILAERAERGDITTEGNEGFETVEPIRSGTFYRTET